MGTTERSGTEPAAAPDPVDQARHWLLVKGADVGPSSRPGPRSDRPGPVAEDDDAVADPEEVARRIVLRKLAAQARTRAELARALQAKAVPEEAAAAVLDRMSEVGLVDDAGFAQDWVSSRQQRRHLSRSALRRELQTKGVAREEIEEALTGVGVAEEHEAAASLARRRQLTMANLPRDVQYRRLAGVLARRGFSSSVMGRVLGEVLAGTGPGPDTEDPDG